MGGTRAPACAVLPKRTARGVVHAGGFLLGGFRGCGAGGGRALRLRRVGLCTGLRRLRFHSRWEGSLAGGFRGSGWEGTQLNTSATGHTNATKPPHGGALSLSHVTRGTASAARRKRGASAVRRSRWRGRQDAAGHREDAPCSAPGPARRGSAPSRGPPGRTPPGRTWASPPQHHGWHTWIGWWPPCRGVPPVAADAPAPSPPLAWPLLPNEHRFCTQPSPPGAHISTGWSLAMKRGDSARGPSISARPDGGG
jgi:hypothetical protein